MGRHIGYATNSGGIICSQSISLIFGAASTGQSAVVINLLPQFCTTKDSELSVIHAFDPFSNRHDGCVPFTVQELNGFAYRRYFKVTPFHAATILVLVAFVEFPTYL
jgi:hypothetical protein